LIEDNKNYLQEIEKLKLELENKKKEEINYKASYDSIMFEYDTLNKKFEEIKEKFKLNENSINEIEKLKNENENYKNKINDLNLNINSLENKIKEIENLKQKENNEYREAKTSLELMKNNYNEVKTQYDVLLMKINSLNEENYSLKRELLLYKNNNSLNRIYNNQIDNNLDLPIQNNFMILQKNKNYNSKGKIIRSSYDIINEENKTNNNKSMITKTKDLNLNNLNNDSNNNSEKNNKIKQIETITNSHRKFIGINQNDSSGVSSLLTINIDNNNKDKDKINNNKNNINIINYNNNNTPIKKKKIIRQKSVPSGNINNFPSEAEMIKNEAKINKIEQQIVNYLKERDKYNDELSKFPEFPKQQSLIHQKNNVENIINNLNFKINSCKKDIREIKKKLYG
jgi:predicted  nucleic acid-binding Zn-ribbon protein